MVGLTGTSSTVVPPGGLVFVTGVNGFLASHLTLELLARGYAVRGTVRSADKAVWVKAAIAKRQPNARFELLVVPDLSAPSIFNDLLHDVDGVAFVAGDMTFGPDPNKVITPMVACLRSVLESAARVPSIKRFVLTSSAIAAVMPEPGKKMYVNSNSWNDLSIERAWRPGPYEPERGWDIYAALKASCERELWRFGQSKKPGFVLNSVLPDFIVGPIVHAKQNGSTGRWVKEFFDDPTLYQPLQGFPPKYFVDVVDTALLHIAGLTEEDVKNERLLGFAGPFNFNSWVGAFRKIDLSKQWPADDPNQGHDLSVIETTRSEEILKRYGREGFTPFLESVRSNCLDSDPSWKRSNFV